MTPSLRCRLVATWIAIIAMAALAVIPSLSRALAFGAGAGGAWAEVCTPQGMKRVRLADRVDRAGDDDAGTATPQLDHCSWCRWAGDGPAPLPVAPAALPQPQGASVALAAFWHAPFPRRAWSGARARAPPARS